jgi:hypothetical protein
MNHAAAKFADELRADKRFARCADQFEESFRLLHEEGNTVGDATELADALSWIMSEPRSLDERFEAMTKLMSLDEGKVRISNLRRFLGW